MIGHCQLSPQEFASENSEEIIYRTVEVSRGEHTVHPSPLERVSKRTIRVLIDALLRYEKGNSDGAISSPDHGRTTWESGGGLAVALLSLDNTFSDSTEFRDRLEAACKTRERAFWKRQWIDYEIQSALELVLMCGSRSLGVEWMLPRFCDYRSHLRTDVAYETLSGMEMESVIR